METRPGWFAVVERVEIRPPGIYHYGRHDPRRTFSPLPRTPPLSDVERTRLLYLAAVARRKRADILAHLARTEGPPEMAPSADGAFASRALARSLHALRESVLWANARAAVRAERQETAEMLKCRG